MISKDSLDELAELAYRIRLNISGYWKLQFSPVLGLQEEEFLKEIKKLGNEIVLWAENEENKKVI